MFEFYMKREKRSLKRDQNNVQLSRMTDHICCETEQSTNVSSNLVLLIEAKFSELQY